MLTIKLGQYLTILGYVWMKKYKVLLNIIRDSITFSFKFYTNHSLL